MNLAVAVLVTLLFYQEEEAVSISTEEPLNCVSRRGRKRRKVDLSNVGYSLHGVNEIGTVFSFKAHFYLIVNELVNFSLLRLRLRLAYWMKTTQSRLFVHLNLRPILSSRHQKMAHCRS